MTPSQVTTTSRAASLTKADAENYAEWSGVLAEPTRVRLLHALSVSPTGALRIGDLATALGVSQSTCSHHVDVLQKVGFVVIDKLGTSSLVSINAACWAGLPHAADVVTDWCPLVGSQVRLRTRHSGPMDAGGGS